jgi:hypothetical protein
MILRLPFTTDRYGENIWDEGEHASFKKCIAQDIESLMDGVLDVFQNVEHFQAGVHQRWRRRA